jgi:hypothetical protein
MKRIAILVGVIGLLLCMGLRSASSQHESDSPVEERAVSLKVLQKRLHACMGDRSCPELLLHFGGLTRIEGYILDRGNEDIIVFGTVDPERPPLRTEDFVIALRNALLKYAEMQGNTIIETPPGCSIDMNPKIAVRLQAQAESLMAGSSFEDVERVIDQWNTVCKGPQQVRVLGIPFDTRFAKVMVDADYYMKRIVDGSVDLGIEGLVSLVDMTMTAIREDVIHNRPISVVINPMNRFEFYPGENMYMYDDGIVEITECPVTLITEIEYLTRSGETVQSGKVDPLAQKFADDLTAHYDEVARAKPIYCELEGLFRMVALAQILKFKKHIMGLDYLTDEFPVSHDSVWKTLSGIPNVKEFEHRVDYAGGYQIVKLWLPSCGGVGIPIYPEPNDFELAPALGDLRSVILLGRPVPTVSALYWDFPRGRR